MNYEGMNEWIIEGMNEWIIEGMNEWMTREWMNPQIGERIN